MKLDEKAIAMLIAELKDAQGQALGIVTQAVCQQLDAVKFTDDLRRHIEAARQLPSVSPVALQMATQALAAADASKSLQAKRPGEGPHPNRG